MNQLTELWNFLNFKMMMTVSKFPIAPTIINEMQRTEPKSYQIEFMAANIFTYRTRLNFVYNFLSSNF